MKRDLMSLPLDLGTELIIDNFAGGGGASTGLERAFDLATALIVSNFAHEKQMAGAAYPPHPSAPCVG